MGLGWDVIVYGKYDPVKDDCQKIPIVNYSVQIFGLKWLDELVKKGEANDLGGDGYPMRYSGKAQHIMPTVNREAKCSIAWAVDEMILLEAWDQS